MNETLIALIGTGQQVLKNLSDRNYKKVIYYNKDNDEAFETPFVSEAILNLFPNRFNKLILLGTNSSMWESLYSYCIDPNELENLTIDQNDIFGKIAFAIEFANQESKLNFSTKLLSYRPELIQIIEKQISKKFNIETICKIIPVAENEDELWKIFEILTQIDYGRSILSFDITHGLRYHPMYIFLALNYLTTIESNLKFGSYFYGALELSKMENNHGMAPIIEFKIFGEMLKWISAYKSFQKFKDSSELVDLLQIKDSSKFLADKLDILSTNYSFNFFKDIRLTSFDIDKEVNKLLNDQDVSVSFKLISNHLLKFPKELIDSNDNLSHISLIITKHHIKSRNFGLAYLSLWEAILYNIQEYTKNKIRTFEINKKITEYKKAKNKDFINLLKSINSNLFRNLDKLSDIRNKIAHFDTINNYEELSELKTDLDKLINYFSDMINKGRLEIVANFIQEN